MVDKNNGIAFTYPAKTMGAGAYFSWQKDNDEGFIKTFYVKENALKLTNLSKDKSEDNYKDQMAEINKKRIELEALQLIDTNPNNNEVKNN